MFCNQCGQQLPDGSRFCFKCGANLAALYGEAAPQAAAPQQPQQPTTKSGWMLAAVKDAICRGLKNPDSAKFSEFENVEVDKYGRTYAEVIVYATNSYNAMVPTRYAIGFYDVTDNAPCTVIPKSLYVLPNLMVGAQRAVAKKMMHFNQPR